MALLRMCIFVSETFNTVRYSTLNLVATFQNVLRM